MISEEIREKVLKLQEERNFFSNKEAEIRSHISAITEKVKLESMLDGATERFFLDKRKIKIRVSVNRVLWDKSPASIEYVVSSKISKDYEYLKEQGLINYIKKGRLILCDESTKQLSDLIKFKMVTHHKDNIYLGVTSQKRGIIFTSRWVLAKYNNRTNCGLRLRSGTYYAGYWNSNYFNEGEEVEIIEYCKSKEDIVIALL